MKLKVSRILHAGYVFEQDQTLIAFDPMFENPFSRNCHAFPGVKFEIDKIKNLSFSAVFISHFHDDHCSLESLNLLDRKTPIYMYCLFEEFFSMIQDLGFKNIFRLEINKPVQVGSIEVIPRRALDADVDSMFHVRVAGLNILNVVDSWIDPDTLLKLSEYAPWDLVLWPFQAMRETDVLAPSRSTPALTELPEEWIQQLQVLTPRIVVPSSCQFKLEAWSWYNKAFFPFSYHQFQKEVQAALPRTQVVRMNPSVSISLSKESFEFSSSLEWVSPVGNQDEDYQFQADVRVPPTSEVAQHFDALTEQQTQRVFKYCQSELKEKYQSMESPMEEFFDKPRLWRLSLFDHTGLPTNFHFCVSGNKIEPQGNKDTPLAWTTEIPIAKLYAALELGESLTSLYMRINDFVFEPAIEAEVHNADIVEDPLIRCLYHGQIGAYQRAQLKRLKMP